MKYEYNEHKRSLPPVCELTEGDDYEGKLIKNKQCLTEEEFLKQYDSAIYEKSSLTFDMLIFTVMEEEKENYRKLAEKSLKILLVKRGNHPDMSKWALPGGIVGAYEVF